MRGELDEDEARCALIMSTRHGARRSVVDLPRCIKVFDGLHHADGSKCWISFYHAVALRSSMLSNPAALEHADALRCERAPVMQMHRGARAQE
mmetsp:Transcript_1481/g.3331  ORF Transcript_1481/g.3331 Transcript_1481/m.3331 type:complete len:93 (-) Transcript_1481:37-315(-)|eukprot:3255257-Rhodomonas_salina.2